MAELLAFGEIMLRLSPPGRELILQTPRFDVWVAGAETNVATALARLGHDVGFASAVPANDLGDSAVAALRSHGIDTSGIQRRGERMGLYFVTSGAGMARDRRDLRPSLLKLRRDPGRRLGLGCPARGRRSVAPVRHHAGARAGAGGKRRSPPPRPRRRVISRCPFDGNWRGKLWQRWNGEPREILSRIVRYADLMFGNHRDIALLLGKPFSGDGEDRRREAAEAAFAAFPRLQTIASTARHAEDADRHRLSARIDARDAHAQTDEIRLAGIVDRIGAGDAFAAGVLHAMRSGRAIEEVARIGLALAALKHSLPGDASLFRQADIDAFLEGGLDVRR